MTTVIHIQKAPPGWRDDPQYVYIGRPGKWGNPYSVALHGRTKCLTLHEQAFTQVDGVLHHLRNQLGEHQGKTLVCYCAPLACHGHTLARLADALT